MDLLNNEDPYHKEPVTEFPNWSLILRIQRTNKDSKALRGIENDPEHFEKLATYV